MKAKITNIAPCSIICDYCPSFKEHKCEGCVKTKGKQYWGSCVVYNCSSSKGLEHCGLCVDFPCDKFIQHFDPNNPRGPKNAIFRVGQLTIRKKLGTKEWLKRIQDNAIPSRND